MKNLKILFGSVLVIAVMLLSGCYTQVAMTDNGSDNSGYDNNSQGNYQTPADTNYGNQYDQYGNQDNYDSTQQGTGNNYYYNYPPSYGGPWSSYDWNPRFSLGFYWGSPFYDPYYWDPFGLWSYYPGYYPYYSSFYPTYYPNYYYGYNGYYGGIYGGYTTIIPRSHDTYRLRNNDGFRNSEDRSGATNRNNGGILTTAPGTVGGRTEPTARTMNKPTTTRNEPTTVSGRNNGRQTSGRTYAPRSGNGRNNYTNYNHSRVQNRNNNSGRNEPRTYAPARRTYSPPPRTYSPPQRSYSPPPRSYSAPRSYSPPARSSGGGSSRSSSGGGRRGR